MSAMSRTPRWQPRGRGHAQVAFMLLPNRRQRPPMWVGRIRRDRRGSFRWTETPWHRRVIPVMARKHKSVVRVDTRRAL